MIIIDGKHISEYGLIVERGGDIDEFPETRDLTVPIPGRPGAYDFGAELGSKPFNFPMVFIDGLSTNDLQHKKRDFLRVLLDSYGRPRTFKLQKEYEKGKYYLARYSGNLSIQRLVNYGQFVLPLMAYDPIAYSVSTNDQVIWGSELVTFEYDYVLGHTGGGQIRRLTQPSTLYVFVDGDMVKPLIKLKGTGNDVSFEANGKSFTLTGNLSNAEWEVNNDKRTVTRNGLNAYDRKDGKFIELFNGENELIISGSNLDIELQVIFQDRYII